MTYVMDGRTGSVLAAVRRGRASWPGWVPRVAPAWITAYLALRVYWAAAGRPDRLSPIGGDLIAADWGAVAICALALPAALLLLRGTPAAGLPRKGLLAWSYAGSVALVTLAALFLLDVVGGILPGLGIGFYPLGALSRAACLAAGVLLGLSALSYQRRTSADRDGGVRRLDRVPAWAFWAAYVAVAGCLARIIAQAVVGFGASPLGGASALVFEFGFVLGGTVLPLALVHGWGRTWPRWIPKMAGRRVPRRLVLWPASGISGGLIVYFGLMLLQMIYERLNGRNPFPADESGGLDLPEAFFWAAVPAYFIWGAGMAIAAVAYARRTRPPGAAATR